MSTSNTFLETEDFKRYLLPYVTHDTLPALLDTSVTWRRVLHAFCEKLSLKTHNGNNVRLFQRDEDTGYHHHRKVIFYLNIAQIGDRACGFEVNLRNVDIPDGVESIGESAFYQCINIINVTFPPTLKRIGERAFYNCTTLENVDLLHTNLQKIDNFAFEGCDNLRSLALPNETQTLALGNLVFHRCLALVPSTVDLTESPSVVTFLRLPEDDRRKLFGKDHAFWNDSDEEFGAGEEGGFDEFENFNEGDY